MTVHDMGMDVTEEKYKMPTDENSFEMPVVGLGETAATNMGRMETNGQHSGGEISLPTRWGDNLVTSTTELEIRLKNAAVKYTMKWTLLIITEAMIDMVEIRLCEVIKEINIMNSRVWGCWSQGRLALRPNQCPT